MKLSILICGLSNRVESREILLSELSKQYKGNDIEVITEVDNGAMSIGYKRNLLLSKAKGEYLCFIDDDDEISSDYILKALTALGHNPDCCSLTGVYTTNGDNPEIFEHSIQYKEYKTNKFGAVTYERYPNHLNIIRSSIAKKFRFLEISHGEDTDWATQIFNSGLLKTEATIKGVIYHYKFKTNK